MPTVSEGEAARPRPWFRRPGRVALIALAVVVLIGGAALAVAWPNRGAHQASTEDVVDRFREEGSDTDEPAGDLDPPAGVYTYDGTGTERLSLLDTQQSWGPSVPASVVYDDEGCWTIRVDYSTNHHQTIRYCSEDGVLRETGGETYQRFDFVAFQAEDTTVFVCDPPSDSIRLDAAPGDAWEHTCRGRSSARGTEVTSTGPTTFVGPETIDVGGEPVAALHYRMERTLAGDQRGAETTEHWYAADDAMLLRLTHDVAVASPSPVGDVDYTEVGELTLTSRTPQR